MTSDLSGSPTDLDRSGDFDRSGDPSTQPAVEPVPEGAAPEVAEDPPGVATRFAERSAARVFRRPLNWWNAPWPPDRVVRVLVTSSVLVVTTAIMMWIVHLNPIGADNLVFTDTTPTGGDMGAHVWAPAFLRDHFLPNFQLSGWSMDWYAGLPLYRFYMVLPALAIVALDVVLPYGIAFKLVAILGLVTFPFVCWAFGRLANFRRPIPELFAFAGLCFLLDESYQIYGGNVKSTMAGEYSFSIALTLAVLGLGLLANGLRTGKYRVWTAVILSFAAVSHGIVLIFVAVAAIVLCLVWIDRRRLVYATTVGVATLLLSAWWVGPFLFGHEFMTDMKYGFRPEGANDSFYDMFFPLAAPLDFLVTTFAIVGFGAMVIRRQLTGIAIGIICLVFVGLVYVTRDSLPGIGLLWNPRLLPFVYLTRYLLMVIGIYEAITWLINAARGRLATADLTVYEGAAAVGAVGVSILLVFGWMYETLPLDGRVTDGEASVYAWGPFRKGPESGRAVADGWTRYNMQGYEGRSAYPEYHSVVSTMSDIGVDRGCGRALWENNSDNGQYGTTMALMLLPHWTDGCIASMEGLFFEASGTTPYHFLTTAAMSESSSNPVRQLRYTNNDAAVGVGHMLDLGVRYVMLRTDPAKAEAATQEGLEYITTSGPWDIYEVTGTAIVEPLITQPVVVPSRDGDQRQRNLELGTSWFQRRDDWPAIPADDGPDDWQRVPVEIDLDERVGEPGERSRNVDYVLPATPIDVVDLPEVEVTDVEIEQQSLSFHVDEVGVPVLVRVSYFPNWTVEGAEGPYRAGANQMIVVPTSNEVTLTYESRTALDWFFYSLTLLGIVMCIVMRRRGDVEYPSDRPSFGRAGGDDGGELDDDTTAGIDGGPDADQSSDLDDELTDLGADPTIFMPARASSEPADEGDPDPR
ncbi:MAG: hypothetical protein QNM02_01835 [Acidimicrobiia bacterium]|nr:hypothetical protein [Acidimicrobiia bacterium]